MAFTSNRPQGRGFLQLLDAQGGFVESHWRRHRRPDGSDRSIFCRRCPRRKTMAAAIIDARFGLYRCGGGGKPGRARQLLEMAGRKSSHSSLKSDEGIRMVTARMPGPDMDRITLHVESSTVQFR